jgi:hypothetical protein
MAVNGVELLAEMLQGTSDNGTVMGREETRDSAARIDAAIYKAEEGIIHMSRRWREAMQDGPNPNFIARGLRDSKGMAGDIRWAMAWEQIGFPSSSSDGCCMASETYLVASNTYLAQPKLPPTFWRLNLVHMVRIGARQTRFGGHQVRFGGYSIRGDWP